MFTLARVLTRIRPARAALLGGAAVVAIAGVVAWRAASTSTPISVQDALRTFRENEGPGSAAAGPRPGVYTYRAEGAESGTVGPLSIRRTVPAQARYVVTSTPGGFETELQISKQHIEGYRYRIKDGWAVLTWRRVDVTFLGVGRDDRRDVTGTARWIPLEPRVGMRWDVDFWTRTLHATGTGRVTGTGTITVDGAPRRVFVVDIRTVTQGAHGGPHRERLWWSPELRMPLRISSTTRLDGVVGFQSRMDMRLASARPRA